MIFPTTCPRFHTDKDGDTYIAGWVPTHTVTPAPIIPSISPAEFAEARFRLAHDEWLNIQHDTGFCDGGVCDLAPLYQKWWDKHAGVGPDHTDLEEAAFYEWVGILEGGGAREDWITDTIISTVATLGYGGLRGLTRIFGRGAAAKSESSVSRLLGNRVRDERGSIGPFGTGATPLTNAQAADMAARVGYTKTNYIVRGQTVFTNGKTYIVQDTTAHTGGLWKMAKSVDGLNSKRTRMGTYDYNMEYIGP